MRKSITIFCAGLLLITACEDFGDDLRFYNSTEQSYVYSEGLDFSEDTLVSFENFKNGYLHPSDSGSYLGHKWEWERDFKDSKTKKLTILFLYADSINYYKQRYKTPTVFFKENKNYKIRNFTLSQLDSCNWIINVTNDSIWDPKNYWQ